jgi:hypothetical protein
MIDPAAWHGIDAPRLAWLIEHYTRAGDVVLDVGNHPSVAHVAHYLHRHPATLVTEGDQHWVQLTDVLVRAAHAAKPSSLPVSLLLAGLTGPGRERLDLPAMTETMHQWHRLLRPGGFLLTALTPRGTEPRRVSQRSTVITAARATGLRYHQHLPVLLVPLPDTEPRTDAASAATIPAVLLDGRHLPVHLDVLAFAASTIDQESTHA